MPFDERFALAILTLSGEPKNKERRRKKFFLFEFRRNEFKNFSRQPVVFSCEADTVLIFCILFYQEKSMSKENKYRTQLRRDGKQGEKKLRKN